MALAVLARYFCNAAPEYFMPNKVDIRRDEITFVIHCKLWMHLTMLSRCFIFTCRILKYTMMSLK